MTEEIEGTVEVVDTTPETEVEEVVETTEPVEDNEVQYSMEDLIAAEFDDQPEMQGEHKGLPHFSEILKNSTPNTRKLLQNLRSSYTKKTQALAAAQKEVAAEREALLQQTKSFTDSEFAKSINETANDETQHDLWDEDGRRALIKKEAALNFQAMLKPLQDQVKTQAKRAELLAFKTEHPDMTDPGMRVDIAKLLQTRPELKLQDAYFIVRGNKNQEQLEEINERNRARRSDSREALKSTSTGRKATTKMTKPEGSDNWSAVKWFQYRKSQGMR
tara:strand:+ start:56 stop:880 length:825 start_codon:yes stop_codon:yes gene_type:complete